MALINSNGNLIVAAGNGPIIPAQERTLVKMNCSLVGTTAVRVQIATPGVTKVRVRGPRRSVVVEGSAPTDIPLAKITHDTSIDPLPLQFAEIVGSAMGGYGPPVKLYRAAVPTYPVNFLAPPTILLSASEVNAVVVIGDAAVVGADTINVFMESQAADGTGAITRYNAAWAVVPSAAGGRRIRVSVEARWRGGAWITQSSRWVEIDAGAVVGEPWVTADVVIATATTVSARQTLINAALAAVPSGLNRRYIIGLPAADYGDYNWPNNYNTKGSTLVQLRSETPNDKARFTAVSASGARNIEIEELQIWSPDFDRWGYPAGTTITFNGVRGVSPHRCRVRNCTTRGGSRGGYFKNCWNIDIEFNFIEGAAIDQFAIGADALPAKSSNVRVANNRISSFHPTATFPDLTATIGYNLERNEATDPRRSDQEDGNFPVADLDGILVPFPDPGTSAGTRGGRHPDLIQCWGFQENTIIEDNQITCGNLYRQGIFMHTELSLSAPFSTGVIVRRNEVMTAHVHAIACLRQANPQVYDNRILRNPISIGSNGWGENYHKGTKGQGIMFANLSTNTVDADRGSNPATTVIAYNNALPANQSSWHNKSKITVPAGKLPNIYSNDASNKPIGWDEWAVAKGRVGPRGYEVAA